MYSNPENLNRRKNYTCYSCSLMLVGNDPSSWPLILMKLLITRVGCSRTFYDSTGLNKSLPLFEECPFSQLSNSVNIHMPLLKCWSQQNECNEYSKLHRI